MSKKTPKLTIRLPDGTTLVVDKNVNFNTWAIQGLLNAGTVTIDLPVGAETDELNPKKIRGLRQVHGGLTDEQIAFLVGSTSRTDFHLNEKDRRSGVATRLARAFEFIWQGASLREEEFLKRKNIGRKALDVFRNELQRHGLDLGVIVLPAGAYPWNHQG